MFCNTECPEYQTPCVKHICQLQPPLPYLLYIMNIIGLIIYFIPNKGKSKYLSGREESHIKTRGNEDIVYDRGKYLKRSLGKLERDECEEETDEPSRVKTKNKDFTKYKLGMSEKINSYYKYDEEKSDGCSSTSYEKKSDESSIVSYEKKSNENSTVSYEKKSDENSIVSYDKKSSECSSLSYEKTGIECDENIREKSYFGSDDFRIQQTDECTESPRKQQFSHSYGEERKRKLLGKDKDKGPSELRKKKCNKRPEMKIYIETGSNEYPPAFGDENKTTRTSRLEPKVTLIKSPSVDQEESTDIPNEKVESRKNTVRSKASIVTHFSAQMNELDEQIKGKMEKLNSYSPQGEEDRRTSIGRKSKQNSHISLHDEVVKIPSISIISQLNPPFPSADQDKAVLEKSPSFVTTKKITIQSENSPPRHRRTITPEQDISVQEPRDQREKTVSSDAPNRRSVKSVNVQIWEDVQLRQSDRPSTKFHPSVISATETPTKLSFERPSVTKRLSQKSSGTSVSVNSMILVDSLEALALTKLITNELNHAIKKEDTDKQSYCKNQSKDSVVQRSEVELLVMPRELLKVREKIETKLNAIIRQGGPKCAYIKELKKFFPYISDKAIFPCNINYGRSNKILCQKLFHRLLRKLRKKYDEIQKSNFLSKRNAHVGGFVFVKRNDKNDHSQNVVQQSNALENQPKVEKKREDLFVKKSNEGRRGNSYYQNYFERQGYKQHLCPAVINKGESGRRDDAEAKFVSDGKNKPTTSLNIKKELTQKGLKSSLVERQTLQCDDGFYENEDTDYKVTSVIKKLYDNDHSTYHTFSTDDDMSCAKRVLKLKVIAEDLKRIHSDLDENLQNLRKFIAERPQVTAQNAGDYVKELCKNGVDKEQSRNILKDRYTPLFSSKNPKFQDASTPKSTALSDFRQNTLIRKNFPQYSASPNGRLSKANRYFAKTKPRSYKFKGNLHMKHIRDSKRKTTLKMLIWKHLFQEVMRETFKNASVKTLLSVLNQSKTGKMRSGKRNKCKSIVNEKSSIPAKSSTKTIKSSDDVVKPEPFAKPEEVKIKPSTSTSETFMIEEIEKCSNKYSASSQIKTSESAHSVLQEENVKELTSNKLSEQEVKEVCTPLETPKVNSSVSKSTSTTNSSQDKLRSNSLEDCSNGKDTKDSWTSVVSQEEKIDSDNRQELKRSLTEVLDLLIRPCPGPIDSQRDLSTFNSENSNENTMYLANDTYKMIDSIYSLTPKMVSTGSQDDTGAITNMASWKNAFDIVLQYSASSKELNLVEEESIEDHLESDLL